MNASFPIALYAIRSMGMALVTKHDMSTAKGDKGEAL